MAVDLGEGRVLAPSHYCLRSHCHTNHKLRTWELQGSDDGENWTVLRRHDNDRALGNEANSTASWPLDTAGQEFRHFRIQQKNENSTGQHFLTCGGIELYGRATFSGVGRIRK